MPRKRSSMSASVSTATPHLPDLAERELVVGVATHERRQVERGRQAVAAGGEQLVEAAVRVERGAEAGEHAHRPQLRAVHRRVRPARVRDTGPGTRRRRGRRRRRPEHPTWSRSRRRGRRRVEGFPPLVAPCHPHQVTSRPEPTSRTARDAVVAAGRVAAVDRDRLAGHERRVAATRGTRATAAISSGRPSRRSLCSSRMCVAHVLQARHAEHAFEHRRLDEARDRSRSRGCPTRP